MALAKKNNSPFNWGIGLIILFVLFAKALKEIWPLLLVGALGYGIYRWYKASAASKALPSDTTPNPSLSPRQPSPSPIQPRTVAPPQQETPLYVATPVSPGYKIPHPPKDAPKDANWIPLGESVEIGGLQIDGGMLYVGGILPAPNGAPDPALIDPRKSIAKNGDFTERQTNYWPSYSQISPQARRAYLRWLADGRKHPEADVGYVFLYFYGLERRALVDIGKNPIGNDELPYIIDELKRLYGIYSEKSGSFRNYCGHLIEFLELLALPSELYAKPVPEFPPSYELPFYLRLALGQAVTNGVTIPPHIALAWVELDPAVTRRTAVIRCQEVFRKLFEVKYKELPGSGLKIAPNKTKLKLSYRPASAGFHGTGDVTLSFGDIPDITALTAPVKKLQAIVDECTEALDPYSRFLGRNPGTENTLEALLQLPVQIWPASARTALANVKARIGDGMAAMTLKDLAGLFNSAGELNRDKMQALARALETEQIGVEPDILGGAKAIKADDTVVLFHSDQAIADSRATPAYQAVSVTLELAAAVAHADGEFSASELQHLNTHIDSWMHLTPAHQRRLKARARLLMAAPVSLASMKKKVEPLGAPAREAIASFAAMMVQADGVATAEEVKLLEKIYKLLGLERNKVYSDVHAAASSNCSSAPIVKMPSSTATKPASFSLDSAKIAALQQDSEKVSALLVDIFTEEAEAEPVAAIVEAEPVSDKKTVLGLDDAHSAFARMLLSRSSWQRDELTDVAQDLEIMLDGALERLNEAALDTFDLPFTEGEDPVEINPEIIEKIEQ